MIGLIATAAAVALAPAAVGGAGGAGARPSCKVIGKVTDGPDLTRTGICRAVLEGLGAGHPGVDLVIRFEAPATATARLTENGVARPPVSIAINDRALTRADLVDLGRTIAGLLPAR